jgi:hypothetical protein
MKPPASVAFALSVGRGASARSRRDLSTFPAIARRSGAGLLKAGFGEVVRQRPMRARRGPTETPNGNAPAPAGA